MIPELQVSLRSRLATATLALSLSLAGAGIVAAQEASPAAPPAGCTVPATAGATPSASPAATSLTAGPVVDDPAIVDALTKAVTACAPGATELTVQTVYGYADGRYGVDYQYLQGKQLLHYLDLYSNQGGAWTLIDKLPQAPKTDKDTITASVKVGGEAGIEVSPGSFPAQPAVDFHVNNQGTDAATFALYAGPADFDAASVKGAAQDALPDTLKPVGTSTVSAGTELDVIFEGLDAGAYVIVIFDSSNTATQAATVTLSEPVVLEVPNVVGGGNATATPAS